MAQFQPSGIIKIGRVKFDNSYKHVMSFSSLSEQTSYFSSVCAQSFTRESYTYIRPGYKVKVPINAENLYSRNYAMFQNANYGNKWFYAFIINVEYVNANTTELTLELDVWQTWYFDWNERQCFVEREHVNDDSIGAHTNPEPEIPLRQKVQTRNVTDLGSNMTIICQTAAKPSKTAGAFGGLLEGEEKGTTLQGNLYSGVYNGTQSLATDLLNEAVSHPLSDFLEGMQASGIGDSVSSVYMIPKVFLRGGGFSNNNTALEQTRTPTQAGLGVSINRPSSLDGYHPSNNKLFVYPYTFARISDNNNSSADLLFEWTPSGNLGINIVGSMESSGEVFVYPSNYAGVAANYSAGIEFSAAVQCSWPFGSYKNWASQNSVANAISFGINAALFLVPFAKGAATAAKGLGAGARWLAKHGAQANADRVAGAMARTTARRTADSIGTMESVAMGAGAMGMANLVSTYSVQSRQPETSRGTATGNGIYSCDMLAVNCDVVVPLKEYAQIVDDFFSMYGYQVDIVKRPNLKGRKSWNYVKTANACNYGPVPTEDMAMINSILDSGVTIWHNDNIGNYDQDNSIV